MPEKNNLKIELPEFQSSSLELFFPVSTRLNLYTYKTLAPEEGVTIKTKFLRQIIASKL